MADLQTLTTRLNEAEAALHSLLTAQKAVTVQKDGMQVTYSYSPAALGQLRAYAAELRLQVAAAGGTRSRRAIGFTFR